MGNLNLKTSGGGSVVLSPASTGTDVTVTVPATASTLLTRADGSSNAVYTPAGTGAVATTVQSKLRESVSVKDFGAVGDGVTDDSAAVQAAVTYASSSGLTLVFPAATYFLSSQITATRAGQYNDWKIEGYGAVLLTSGAISALKISTSQTPYQTIIEGLSVNHRGNATATAAFELQNTTHVTLRNCTVEAHGVGAGYAAVWLHNGTASDANTGCFWTTVENIAIRKRSGTDVGDIPHGVLASGSANATSILGGSISSCTNAITLTNESGQTFTPNGCLVANVWIEGNTTGVNVVQPSTNYVSGLRIVNCRLESLTTFLSLTGSSIQPAVPTYCSGNYLISSVSSYLNNPNNQYVTILDYSVTPTFPAFVVSNDTINIRSLDNSKPAINIWQPNVGQAFRFSNNTGSVTYADISYSASGKFTISPNVAGGVKQYSLGIGGISSTATSPNNFMGTATFAASTTVAVTFAVAEPDSTYYIFLEPSANQTLWITSKSTSGFTINSSVSNSAAVRWMLIR